MKVFGLVFFIGALSVCSIAQGEYPKQLDVVFTHGVPGPDYVTPEKDGAQVYAARLTHPSVAKNFKTFAIRYKGWSLMGDFAFKPEFYYELDPLVLKGKTREVSFHRISKYPSLVKRYNAVRPTSVNFLIYLEFEWSDPLKITGTYSVPIWTATRLGFRVKDINLGYQGARSATNITSPTTLLHWKDGVTTEVNTVAFTPSDRTDEAKVKNIFKDYKRYYSEINTNRPNVFLEVKWPDEVIDQIAIDYDRYEKEGKDLEKEYADLKQAPKGLKKVEPNADMALPFEDVPKKAEPFREGDVVGLKSKGRKVFESREHFGAEKLDDPGRFFVFQLKKLPEYSAHTQVISAAGKVVEVGGHTRFIAVFKGSAPDTYSVVVDEGRDELFRSEKAYYSVPTVFTRTQWRRFREFDRRPPESRNGSGGGLILTFSSYWFGFNPGKLYTVDSRFRIVSTEDAYFTSGRTSPRSGQNYISGGSYTN